MLRVLFRRLAGGREVSLRHLSSHSKPRHLTASEALGALHPFYLAVHPDLFSQYPREKAANEEALKSLHSYLESLNSPPSPSPPPLPQLTFFLLRHNAQSGKLKSVDIPLPLTHSVGHAVHVILHSCGLLDRISDETRARLLLSVQSESPVSADWGSEHVFKDLDLEKWEDLFEGDSRDKYRPLTLDEWLREYAPVARVANEHSQPIREENRELLGELCTDFGIGGIHCSVGWTATTQRGYLCGLRGVLEREGDVWGEVVERWGRGVGVGRRGGGGGGVGREGGWSEVVGDEVGPVLVVGHGKGVDVHGRICFDYEDTPQQWSKYLQSLREPLLTLHSLGQLEQEVMGVFRGAEILRPGNVSLEDYHEWVGRMVRGCGGSVGWDVVLGEQEEEKRVRLGAGMECRQVALTITRPQPGPHDGLPSLTSEGVVQVPASCPAQRLAMFLQTHQHGILQRRTEYNRLKALAERALLHSRDHLGLSSLSAQPSLGSQRVVEGCQRLAKVASNPHITLLKDSLAGQQVRLGLYYLISGDGELTVPWDFQCSTT